jgi:peptide/nickel transport system permease protein
MAKWIIFRIVYLLPVLFGASVIVFVLIKVTPGDPVVAWTGPFATSETREKVRVVLGLDRHIVVQYYKWISSTLQGDLGVSFSTKLEVKDVVWRAFRNTVILTVAAGGVAMIFGVWLGIISALKRGRLADKLILAFATLGLSVPPYWLSLMVIFYISLSWGWLPTGGIGPTTGGGGIPELIRHLILPAIVASVIPMGIIARVTRTAMLETLGQDYLTGLRAKGLKERTVIYKHALRNAMPTITTMIGLQMAYLMLGTAAFVEIIFRWPGLGLETFQAIGQRDLPLLMGIVLISTLVFAVFNLVVDIIYTATNPRVRPS